MSKVSSISSFMDETLARLSEKDEPPRNYLISETDLVTVNDCIVCGSSDIVPVAEVYRDRKLKFFETSVCKVCLFTFRSLSPSYHWFQSRWEEISTGAPQVFNTELELLRKQRYEQYLKLVRPHVASGRMLDIGAAFGSGVCVFRDAGFEVEALEPENDRVIYLRDELGISTHGTVLNEFEPQGSYDLITFAHVLEHVDDPVEMLTRVRQWLTPETGVLYLEVPLLWNIVDFKDSMFMAHKSNFNEYNLAQLARRLGFQVLETDYPCLNAEKPDIGLVLRPVPPEKISAPTQKFDIEGKSAADIMALYRRELPFPDTNGDEVLHISVPLINHFYYTVRYDEGEFVDRRSENGFIEFEASSFSN